MNDNLRKLNNTILCIKTVRSMLRDYNIPFTLGCIEKLLSIVENFIADVLDEALNYARNNNRENIELSDIQLVISLRKCENEKNVIDEKISQEFIAEFNEKPLPDIKQNFGILLPSAGEYCLNKQNFRLKTKSMREMPNHSIIDLTKYPHQIFSTMNMKLPTMNINMKGKMGFSQQATYSFPVPNALLRFNSAMANGFPILPMQKSKVLPQMMNHPQKITIKPKMNFKNNLENLSSINMEQKKEIIKRSISMEPEKILFKPKLLLSLNTNVDNIPKLDNESGSSKVLSPSKRKRMECQNI